MNIRKFAWACMIITTLYSCASDGNKQKSNIEGTWLIQKIGPDVVPVAERKAYIILTKEGVCEQGTDGVCELGGDNTVKGKWSLSENGTVLNIVNEDGSESKYTGVSRTDSVLTIIHEGPVTLEFKQQ